METRKFKTRKIPARRILSDCKSDTSEEVQFFSTACYPIQIASLDFCKEEALSQKWVSVELLSIYTSAGEVPLNYTGPLKTESTKLTTINVQNVTKNSG